MYKGLTSTGWQVYNVSTSLASAGAPVGLEAWATVSALLLMLKPCRHHPGKQAGRAALCDKMRCSLSLLLSLVVLLTLASLSLPLWTSQYGPLTVDACPCRVEHLGLARILPCVGAEGAETLNPKL